MNIEQEAQKLATELRRCLSTGTGITRVRCRTQALQEKVKELLGYQASEVQFLRPHDDPPQSRPAADVR